MTTIIAAACSGAAPQASRTDASAYQAPDTLVVRIVQPDGPAARLDAPRAGCGDGILEAGEDCDDGNFVGGDGCGQYCWVEFGWLCPIPGKPCVTAYACGNALLSPDEACDDGNTVGGDGCSSDCHSVEPGWRCVANGRPCVRLCESDGGLCAEVGPTATCGNGIVEPGEECDEGSDTTRTPHNDDNTYGGCTTRCTYGGYCGDGIVNGPELCDEGSANLDLYGDPGCSFLCTRAGYCGDDIIQAGEECDVGPLNGDWSTPCDPNCKLILY